MAQMAIVSFFTSMSPHMNIQMILSFETFWTHRTRMLAVNWFIIFHFPLVQIENHSVSLEFFFPKNVTDVDLHPPYSHEDHLRCQNIQEFCRSLDLQNAVPKFTPGLSTTCICKVSFLDSICCVFHTYTAYKWKPVSKQ